MQIPNTNRKKALIIIDVQPAFMKPHNEYIVKNIINLIQTEEYDLYIDAVFSAEEDSLWSQQQEWFAPNNKDTVTDPEISNVLQGKNGLSIAKQTRSVFYGDKDLAVVFKEQGIEEVHIAGTETHDCVLASAFSTFDEGYPVYVIEECCESATSGRHEQGLMILRQQKMTNNSCLAETKLIDL